MKTAIYAVLGLSFVNFVGMLVVAAGLVAGGKIDRQRAEEVIALFSETIEQRDARLEREAAEEAAAEAEAEQVALREQPPLTAQQWTDRKLEGDTVLRERALRLRREVDDLRRTLASERVSLDAERQAFEEDRTAFEDMRERLREAEEDDRFQVAIETLASVPTATAASMLLEVEQTTGRDQVVSYLDGLELRQRGKVVAAIEKDDAALAADLLERLRTRGLQASAGSEAPPR